jgi:excisionase family DNA binding protein
MNLCIVKEKRVDETDLLTVHEVARLLRVDDSTVRRWIKRGALEAVALPHRGFRQAYRIRLATLHTVLATAQPVLEKEGGQPQAYSHR